MWVIAQVLQTATEQTPPDEFGSPIFVLVLIATFIAVVLAIAAGIGALVGAGVAAVLAFAAFLATFLAATNFILATIVWTRRPPTRIIVSPRWWALATVMLGPVAAGPFFVLHYRRGVAKRCYRCGYDAARLTLRDPRCPECGTAR